MPELLDVISGRARIDELHDVDVNDLLGRDPVAPDPALFKSCIEGKSVMVTGAGGSIGSELCRQILTLGPRRLVLFEMSELALYTIDQELRQVVVRNGLQVEILPLLGNAHHRFRVREVMLSCRVQTVYHAAAYKHVPIVEHNMIEGLHNNVISTWYTAEAALEAEVETFVLISTDKAVNPANIMGATKRFAELILQGMQARSTKTRFCMVRFGNVLDSSGSVVPLFREQIRKGGPVTVTHPDVTRYFMTIPEAAQLVIQAGAMGKGGDVFVLDMGQPVRIDDLARRMISLMGLTVRDASSPDGDIEIQYTGLRTAEKLFEELLIGSSVTGTEHPRIMRAIEHSLPWDRMQQLLDDLLIALASFDCRRAVARLMDAVAEYEMKGEIQDYVWNRNGADSDSARCESGGHSAATCVRQPASRRSWVTRPPDRSVTVILTDMRVTIFGSGYVGLVTGACLADAGNHVICVDVDAGKIERLNRGEVPIHEPGLEAHHPPQRPGQAPGIHHRRKAGRGPRPVPADRRRHARRTKTVRRT